MKVAVGHRRFECENCYYLGPWHAPIGKERDRCARQALDHAKRHRHAYRRVCVELRFDGAV
jgi:hypothetical protein